MSDDLKSTRFDRRFQPEASLGFFRCHHARQPHRQLHPKARRRSQHLSHPCAELSPLVSAGDKPVWPQHSFHVLVNEPRALSTISDSAGEAAAERFADSRQVSARFTWLYYALHVEVPSGCARSQCKVVSSTIARHQRRSVLSRLSWKWSAPPLR